MITTYTDRAKLLADLNAFFADDLTFWEGDTRQFWMYNTDGTGSYQNQTAMNQNLVGQIGLGTLQTFDSGGKWVTMTTKSTVNRKQHTLTSTIRQTVDSNGAVGYTLETYYTFLYETYLANMDKMRKTASYQKALQMLGVTAATDQEVATIMAKSFWTCVEDVPTIKPSEVVLDIEKFVNSAGRPGLRAVLTVQGNSIPPQRCKWWLYPGENVVGMTNSATNISGEYVWGRAQFIVDTDLRNRVDWVIMNPKNVRVDCMVSYMVDGVFTNVFTSKVIDFSKELPTYNYFAL